MDLIIIVIASALLVPLTIFSGGPARIVLGLLLVLFFPGYTLLASLFPRKTDLGGTTRLALSLGTSIALVALALLFLNFTPWGIRLYPVLISLLLFIVIMAAVAWFRRRRLYLEGRSAPALKTSPSPFVRYWVNRSQWDKALSVLLIAAIIGTVGTAGYVMARTAAGEKFTEFYILGPQGKAEHYPHELAPGEEGKVIVCLVNKEHETAVYRLEVALNGEKVNEIDSIGLEPGGQWEQTVAFAPTRAGPDQKVEFRLYKGPESYRSLHIWIDAREGG